MSSRPVNTFFATPFAAFSSIPSVGDKVDNAIDATKREANKLGDQAYNRVQDLKEAGKDAVEVKRTGVDLYAR